MPFTCGGLSGPTLSPIFMFRTFRTFLLGTFLEAPLVFRLQREKQTDHLDDVDDRRKESAGDPRRQQEQVLEQLRRPRESTWPYEMLNLDNIMH